MPVTLDRRTRWDADLRHVDIEDFLANEFPDLAARHGHLVAQGIDFLGAPPLAIEMGGAAWTFSSDGRTLTAASGVAEGALIVTFSTGDFSDWVQNQRSFNAMLVARELRYRGGTERDVSIWDSLWLTLLEGWPVTPDDVDFRDRDGERLELGRIFTPDDDPTDVAHFLREAGFLHLRGWVDPADMREVSADVDRALPDYYEGDGRSWWATVADGSRRCVRLQEFVDRSPTIAAILRGDRWDHLRRALAGDDVLVSAPVTGRVLEALVKPREVRAGPSDVSFHRDCHLGRHAYGCSKPIVGIAVTASGEENGQLRVVAGSHRALMPVEIAKIRPYLPVVAVPTEAGDVTVHLSCTLHESTPPLVSERRVLYTSFSLPAREPATDAGRAIAELRERVFKILDPAATDGR
ncbi:MULTISPECIES: phytanoyl-CoA dioxygenase family protein [Pseudofrankia]|uniref:phytanoyl-CoA dioxygenase family protein n=1 Tax=Pseudofrankia TaxID=2994363 RepID=UPI000234C795|nr:MULTISPECIES: phytanoyl-CoA dioxygenase family protein [Pseudofrankia]OHV29156.1 phytanoyl-CoA dioxygenase [Pseudofrankia sp. EUN1h]